MAKKKTSRSTQRHRALDVVFEADEKDVLFEAGILDLLEDRRVVSTAQVPIGEFGCELVRAYASNIDDVDPMLEAASEDWALSRMNVVDRTILRLSAAELMVVGTGRALVVSEWANLARELSTERSVGFVMGILNKVADIRAAELGEAVPTKRETEAEAGMAEGEAQTRAAHEATRADDEG
ncbi:transcription antitermination protein NusB [Arcanobacterium haemolyticum]|nr:transcription antitermination protein NusB [Arcanobacterium haemolyticum]